MVAINIEIPGDKPHTLLNTGISMAVLFKADHSMTESRLHINAFETSYHKKKNCDLHILKLMGNQNCTCTFNS